jgi:uncharacterized protein YqgC (DUF456 family)
LCVKEHLNIIVGSFAGAFIGSWIDWILDLHGALVDLCCALIGALVGVLIDCCGALLDLVSQFWVNTHLKG